MAPLFQLGFTSCKAEQTRQGMELQEENQDEKHIEKMIRKNPRIKSASCL